LANGAACYAQFQLEPIDGSTEKVNKIKFRRHRFENSSNCDGIDSSFSYWENVIGACITKSYNSAAFN
jgi:hypothetical protein